MMNLQNCGARCMVFPLSKTAGATASGYIDCLGYDEAIIVALLDTQAATSSNPSVLKLSESDDLTTYADVTAFVGDGVGGFTVPAAGTSLGAGCTMPFYVDLRARKRYLKVTISPEGATQIVGAVAIMGRAENSTAARALSTGSVTG